MLPQDCANVNKLLRQMPPLGFTQHMLPQVCANVNIFICGSVQRNRSGNCGIFVRIHLSKLRIDAKIGYIMQRIKIDIDKL